MKQKRIRIALVALEVFVALSAIGGGIALLSGAIQIPLDELKGSPFVDYTIPALLLLVVIGGGMLFAATITSRGHTIGILVSACAGLAMMIFEIVEAAIIDRTGGSMLLFGVALQAFYFLLGLTIFMLSTSLWMATDRSLHLPIRHVSHA